MTSFNGESYIEQQLDSILSQTRKPDEVIIRDDQSTDRTVDIIEGFIVGHNLSSWRLIRNEKNLGWWLNFYEASKIASGDIIFFGDQDDIWHPDKIETMERLMIENKMGALYTAKNIIDGEGIFHLERMDKKSFTKKMIKIPLSENFYSIKTLGCCMCVSREVLNTYISLNYPAGGHDSQCGRIALLYSSLWYLDKPLIDYRIHNNNTSGISVHYSYGASRLDKRIKEVKSSLELIGKLQESQRESSIDLKEVENALKKRLAYLEGKDIYFLQLIKLKKFYSGITMLVGDFAYRHKLNTVLGKIRWSLRRR